MVCEVLCIKQYWAVKIIILHSLIIADLSLVWSGAPFEVAFFLGSGLDKALRVKSSILDLNIESFLTTCFVSSELAGRIDSYFRRMFRYGLCQNLYSFCELADFRDLTLFSEIRHPYNCIHCLLPSEKSLATLLRPRGHNFLLPRSKTNLHKHSFVTRCLYKLV
jgi:hypothetical protein